MAQWFNFLFWNEIQARGKKNNLAQSEGDNILQGAQNQRLTNSMILLYMDLYDDTSHYGSQLAGWQRHPPPPQPGLKAG